MTYRVGAVPYLNGKPLIHGLDRHPDVVLTTAVPSRLAAMLEKHEIAAGLVSSAACFFSPDLRIVPGIGISSRGEVQSIKVFHKGRIQDVRRVALDTSSLTSVLLARVILRERYELSPEFVSMSPSVDDMLRECDAAMVIGDTAMRVPPGRWSDIDLGEEWYSLTGLPFVFAVWAAIPDMMSAEAVEILHCAKEAGLSSLEDISESETRRLGLPYEVCYRYLSKIIHYDLSEEYLEGLRVFGEKVRAHGLVEPFHSPKLLDRARIGGGL